MFIINLWVNCDVLLLTIYYSTSLIHDVMHVFAVTSVVRMCSGAQTACCSVLSWLLTGLLFTVLCPLFLGRRGRQLSLGSLATTSQVVSEAGFEGVVQFSVYYLYS